jgi:hypothetical protein
MRLFHFTGVRWMPDPSMPADLLAVWGSGPAEVWTGGQAELRRWDGMKWSATFAADLTIQCLWGGGTRDLWAGMPGGYLIRLDRQAQPPGRTGQVSGTDQAINGLWGSSPDDVWAVGDSGTILRYQP